MWWPRALRRPTDLWRRLPWVARAVRASVSAFLLVLPAMILLRADLEAAVGEGGPLEWFGMVESALVIGVALATIGGLTWAWRHGLSWSETARMLVGATTPSYGWAEPTMARLLAPAAGASRPPERDTPAEHKRAIVDLASTLPMSAKEVGSEAATAAKRLHVEIEICDAECAALGRDASAKEIEHLTVRLSALERDTSVDPTRQELIAVVRRELELVRQMHVGCELIAQRRTRLFNLLRGLWTQLCLVRDSSRAELAMLATLIERVRSLCREIDDEIEDRQEPASSRLSQARAVAHSRLTVAGETSRASAVSSMFNPPK